VVAHKMVSHDEWVAARKKHLAKEKEFTHLRDQLSRERRELPWELVDKDYTFEGESGKISLQDLFAGRSQRLSRHVQSGNVRAADDLYLRRGLFRVYLVDGQLQRYRGPPESS
jgi:predicted dithiol-disulfide oxidoreductase (DUF899 family)